MATEHTPDKGLAIAFGTGAFVPSASSPFGSRRFPLQSPIADVPAADVLSEIIGHLGAAISQSIPTDDQIIMEHVRAAHELARLLRRAA